MHDKPPLPAEQQVLHRYEQQLRNQLAMESRVGRVLDAIENRLPKLTTELRQQLSLCDHEALLDSVIRLRTALENRGQ
jgi:hypothetical protein